jgi:hypothetical protein
MSVKATVLQKEEKLKKKNVRDKMVPCLRAESRASVKGVRLENSEEEK